MPDHPIVIVGAGTLGLYLAKILVDRGHAVTVIESGTAVLSGFSSGSHASVGKFHRGIATGRSRSIGGTSNLWGGQLVEFQARDLQPHAALGMDGWPITYEDLRPYYQAAYQSLGIPLDFQQDEPIWRAAIGETPRFNEGVELFLTRWMKTPSLALLYADDIRSHPRLHIRADWNAVGFDCTHNKCTGVVVRNRSGNTETVPADTVVIAAGTIETVRLLLAAASDDGRSCPWRGNPALGLKFQDHLGGRLGTVHPTNRAALFRYFSTIYSGGLKFQPKLRLCETLLDELELPGVQAWLAFDSSVSEHLVYLKQFLKAAIYSRQFKGTADFVKHAVACAKHLPPLMWTYVKDHRIYVPFDSRITLSVQSEQKPLTQSRLFLDTAHVDEYGLPRVVLDWRIDGVELEAIRELAVRFHRTLREEGLGIVEIEPDLLDRKPRFLDTLYDTYHAAGGAVMGTSWETGVVNSDLRIFGTCNVFVASAATLPTSSSANVTFTAFALARRLADFLS